MDKELAISITNLSKRFRRAPASRHPGETADDTSADRWFWALKEINMSIRQGQVAGLIGHNGAGKSTLLKIISGIMLPTEGEVKINGRVASLLEVGTGFHPELTGRENIYLNASILGIPRAEVNRRFNEIVDFSGVEDFIETPVKYYSSGMVVRLGFSVAAHLDSEIMIIDEVLAVGDLEFQERSAARIKGIVEDDGRTVIMVSHNLASVNELCDRCFLLEKGALKEDGKTLEVADDYINSVDHRSEVAEVGFGEGEGPGDEVAILCGAAILGPGGEVTGSVDLSDPVAVKICYRVIDGRGRKFLPSVWFHAVHGQVVFTSMAEELVDGENGIYESICRIPGQFLNNGPYYVSVSVSSIDEKGMKTHINEDQILRFVVVEDIRNNLRRFGYTGVYPGVLRPRLDWESARI